MMQHNDFTVLTLRALLGKPTKTEIDQLAQAMVDNPKYFKEYFTFRANLRQLALGMLQVTAASTTPGQTAIAYDGVNKKVVLLTNDGSLAFVNTATRAVTFSNIKVRRPGRHLLLAQGGAVYAASERDTNFGYLYVVDGNTQFQTGVHDMMAIPLYTDSMCYADNIGKIVLLNSQPNPARRFYLFDPTGGSFTPSVALSTSSFNYENYYVRATGHMIASGPGGLAQAEVLDIAFGANAGVIQVLDNVGGPWRVSSCTEDTCHNRLFLTDNGYAIYEFSLDGSYTPISLRDDGGMGINADGLNHSRRSNLVYWTNATLKTVFTGTATP